MDLNRIKDTLWLLKAHLANRGVDLGDYEGPPVVGDMINQSPVERGVLAAPKGAKAAPWVNPNLPQERWI